MINIRSMDNKYLSVCLAIFLFLPFLNKCISIQERADISGLKDIAQGMLKNFKPGSPQDIKDFIKEFSLERDTSPVFLNQIKVSPLDKWKLKHPLGKDLIMEKITFPSLIEHKLGNDKAVFYVYRSAPLRGRKIILWVPGMGVSDFAFHFIKNFFHQELLRDYDIVFYVPPFHMERSEKGMGNGEGFFTSDVKRNITVILNTVRELRTVYEYLQNQGVKSAGGWGGSMGASMLLLASQFIILDHLCIMIPIINWNTVALDNIYMKDVTARYEDAGFLKSLLARAYGLINPVSYPINIESSRVHIMYALYDQLTPFKDILGFANKNGITNITSYKRSHASILLSDELYEDCGKFLDMLYRKNQFPFKDLSR